MTRVLVELCAGSAAVSMRSLGMTAPTRYMGGKGRLARKILAELGVDSPPDRIVLVDPGPWGTVWDVLPRERRAVVQAMWYHLAAVPDHGVLYKRLAAEPHEDLARVEYVARFLLLQTVNWRSKPVGDSGRHWVTSGHGGTFCYGAPATPRFGRVRPQLPVMVDRLANMSGLDRIEGLRCDARDICPIPGAHVYVDPPYQGTEGYGHEFDRSAVIAVASRWSDAGARVAISEAEPLPEVLRSERLGVQGASSGLSSGPRRVEWLSLCFPASQLSLFGGTHGV